MSNQTTQIVPFKQKVQTVAKLLNDKRRQLELALPKHITVDRMLGVALRSIQKTPKLVECDHTSLLNAIMQSAQLGLECDGVLGQAFLIPFKQKVSLIPGYRGLLKLARNSGEIATIQAHEVHENDRFEFHYGLDPKLEHCPTDAEEPGKIVAFYAVARLKDGSSQFEVMWARQVMAIRDRSQGYKAAKQFNQSTPWDTDFAEMGKKTVLRRLCKMLPSSTELQKAVVLDEQAEAGIPQDLDAVIDVEASESEEGKPAASKLTALVEAKQAASPGGKQRIEQSKESVLVTKQESAAVAEYGTEDPLTLEEEAGFFA